MRRGRVVAAASSARLSFAVAAVAGWVAWLNFTGVVYVAAQDAATTARPITLNADGRAYESHPSAAVLDNGSMWVAWHAYHEGADSVVARRLAPDGTVGGKVTISESGKIHSPPTVVDAGDAVWCVWSTSDDGRWRIVARRFADGTWGKTVAVSPPEIDAIHAAAVSPERGRLVVAYSGRDGGRFGIRVSEYANGSFGPPRVVSSNEFDAHRPALAVTSNGATWIFWDQYEGRDYTVRGRPLTPELGPIEQVSPAGEYCLTPTVLATRTGMYVAWLRKADVMGGPGVVSQWHTLHVARRTDDGWRPIVDAQGNNTAAELTHGLMAKIDPTADATGGYLGRRVHPMLVDDGDAVWLLWERKSRHEGSTWQNTGELLARPIRGDLLQEPVRIDQGYVDYHTVDPPLVADGRVTLLASELPRATRRIYRRIECDLAAGREFEQERWTGWRPVALPVAEELTPRREIRVDGKTYRLWWADMHCHSGLTADAEGEPDELTHYARDRARLDVVVFTNNDFIYDVPLVEHEYALGNLFAATYTREGAFLSLPGFEWTSRVPGVRGAPISDPGNWTPPYQFKSYPNHRSVVYPASGGPLLHYPEVANDIAALNVAVAAAGGVTLTQHDAFLPSGHLVEVAMELTSGWRRYIERRPELFHDPLFGTARLGFVANGDSHRRAPGLSGALTGIYAEELTVESILEALRARRCFATSGSRVFVDARADGVLMGQDVPAKDRRVHLTLQATGTRPITRATLIRDGQEIHTVSGTGGKELEIAYDDVDLAPGTHWYYWRIAQDPELPELPGNLMPAFGHLAWSTPHWVVVK